MNSTRQPVATGARRWAVAWVVLVVAGALLALATRGAGPLPGDLALTRLLQRLPPDGAAGLMLSYIGDAVWFLPAAALAVALLLQRWSAALLIFLAGVTGWLVGDALKLLVARPRPPVELVQTPGPSDSYGFPSGTALLAVMLLGTVCYLIRYAPRPGYILVLATSFILVVAVGLSRVYVGEHWATDVLGGWLFGVAWLLLLVAAHRRWSPGGRVEPDERRRGDGTGTTGDAF